MPVPDAVLRGLPVAMTVTAGHASADAHWRRTLQAGRLNVVNRGYVADSWFQDIHDTDSRRSGLRA